MLRPSLVIRFRRMNSRGSLLGDPVSTWLMWLAFLAAFVGGMVVIDAYGRAAFWPGLVTNFGASLAAFLLALQFEHEREAARASREAAAAREAQERDAKAMYDRLVTEAQRRFEPVREELRRNEVSLKFLYGALDPGGDSDTFRILHPELLDGAWQANAPRLTEIIADYTLTSDLAASYGRIEELRWRLRHRTAQLTTALDGMTKPLVDELLAEVRDLSARVTRQIEQPDVQTLGRIHEDAGEVYVRLTASSG
jgi:hypothetical protein